MSPHKLFALLLCLPSFVCNIAIAEITSTSFALQKNLQVATTSIEGKNLEDKINNTHVITIAHVSKIATTDNISLKSKLGLAQRYDLFTDTETPTLSTAKHALFGLHTDVKIDPNTTVEVGWDRYTHLRQEIGRKQKDMDIINLGLSISTL